MNDLVRLPAEELVNSLVGDGRTKADLMQAMTEIKGLMASLHLTHVEGRIFLKAVRTSLDEMRISPSL